MQISMRPIDFGPKKLVCLAENLRNRYRDRKTITFYIFSSDAAAKHWFPQQEQTKKSAEMEMRCAVLTFTTLINTRNIS